MKKPTETSFVSNLIFEHFQMTPSEFDFEGSGRINAQKALDKCYPQSYKVEVEYNKATNILTYTLFNLSLNAEVIKLIRNVGYKTPDDQSYSNAIIESSKNVFS